MTPIVAVVAPRTGKIIKNGLNVFGKICHKWVKRNVKFIFEHHVPTTSAIIRYIK